MSRDPIMDAPSYSVREFCLAEGLSTASYYKLRKAGYGPTELRIPGSSIIRITSASRAEWQRRMAEVNQQEAVRLEKERAKRTEHAHRAAKNGGRPRSDAPRRGRPRTTGEAGR